MPSITTKRISEDAIDEFLHSEFLTESETNDSTTSTSYVDIANMTLNITPPIKCDMMINFGGTFRQSGEISALENMYAAIEIDGSIVAETPFLSWIFIDTSGDFPTVYQEEKQVSVIYTAEQISATSHTIKAKMKTGQATCNVQERTLQAILFHR